MVILKCQCGEEALPTNWFIKDNGRLWYCFNCQSYLDLDRNKIAPETEKEGGK